MFDGFPVDHGFIHPNNVFKPVVQVLACPLHSPLFVLCLDHLAVSAPMKSPAKNHPRSNNRTLTHLVAHRVHHFHKLSGCTLIIDLHVILDHCQDFRR